MQAPDAPAAPAAEPAQPMLTLDVIRAEHGRLLERGVDTVLDLPGYLRDLRAFVDRLVVSGAYFDEVAERRALQAYLDHWTTELCDHSNSEARSALRHLELQPYDAAALRGLQDRFANPFGMVAKELATGVNLSSPSEVLKWLEDKAKAAGLRFQEGMLKEIAGQIATDAEGATLLEFCLWHLFEDPATRCGNRIARPEGDVFFVCAAYLTDQAERLRTRQPAAEQDSVVAAIARFTPGKTIDQAPKPLPEAVVFAGLEAGSFTLYRQEGLDLPRFLAAARLTFPADAQRLRLVHRSLLTRWSAVVATRAEQAERVRGNRRAIGVAVACLALIGLGLLGWRFYQGYAEEQAERHAGQAADLGAKAMARVFVYSDAYSPADYAGGATERKAAVATAIYQGARDYYAGQLTHAIAGLKWFDSDSARNSVNEGIAGTIGFLAQVGALGALPPYAKVEAKASDGDGAACESEYCVSDGVRRRAVPHDESARALAAPVLNVTASLLAGVWQGPEGVTLQVFEVRLDGSEGPVLQRSRKVPLPAGCAAPTVRFVDKSELTVDCGEGKAFRLDIADPGAQLQALPSLPGVAQTADPNARLLCDLHVGSIREGGQEILLRSVPAVYLAPAASGRSAAQGTARSLVTAGSEGYVRVWPGDRPGCPRAQFFSDFIRMVTVGSPVAIAFHDAGKRNLFAIYHDQPSPVVRIFEQHSPNHAEQLVEHYPQFGLGTPVALRFTANGRCLQVQARRRNPLTLAKEDDHRYVRLSYFLMVDAAGIDPIAHALEQDLHGLTASELLAGTARWSNTSRYREAVESVCGVKLD